MRQIHPMENRPLLLKRPKPIDRLNLLCMVAYELFVPDNVPLFATACAYTLFATEPRSYQEAMKRPDAAEWKKATDAERMALVSAETWTICDLPDGFTPLPSTMVYKIKQTKDGLIDK